MMEFVSVPMLTFSLLCVIEAQEIPTVIQYPGNMDRTENGSSETGNCSNLVNGDICADPTSSVLFDGIIPILTRLDGNMWASQLLTIRSSFDIRFGFTGTQDFVGVRRVEIVLFNCPEWGISVQTITLQTSAGIQGTTNPNITSCDSLVRVCIGNLNTNRAQDALTLTFTPINPNDWVHIAEVEFYAGSPTCPVIATPTLTATTTESTTGDETTTALTTPGSGPTASTNTNPCLSTCSTSTTTMSTSTVLASVISIITTALLATVIFVLVQIALCKYHPKFTPGRAESAPSAGGEGQATYEQVDGEGGVAVSDPTYMEVGAGGGANMELKQNEAYGATVFK